MLTRMTEEDWTFALQVFDAAQSSRGEPGRDDRKFLEAILYFTVHNISWRALPAEYGKWNSVWKRFWRLSRTGVFEAFFQLLAEQSRTAHLVQFFDSTVVRAHVSAAGAKGGRKIRRLAAHAGDWCKTGGQAATAVGSNESLAGRNLRPNSESNVPL
jgi:transposase